MTHPRQLLLLASLLVLTARAQEGPAPSWVESLHLAATGNAAWVNNLSRTSSVSNRKDAATYELSLNGDQPRQIAPSLLLVARGGADFLHVPDFPEAGNARFAGSLTLQHKFGLGPQATVLSAQGGLTYKAARYSGDSGWGTDFKVQLAKRVLTNLRLAASAQWLEHNARSPVFDLNQFSYSLDVTWDISERWTLSGSAGRLSGDIVANTSWPVWGAAIYGAYGPVVKNYYTSRPWSVTNIYGPGWVSYNVEADVDLWSVTLAYAVSDHTSLELRQSAAFVVNYIGVRYPTDAVSLSLTHRF